MSHPLHDIAINGVSIKCFDQGGSGFFEFGPTTVVIGKNNAGKSTVIDLVAALLDLTAGPAVPESQQRVGELPYVDVRPRLKDGALESAFSKSSRYYTVEKSDYEFIREQFSAGMTWRVSHSRSGEVQDHSFIRDLRQDEQQRTTNKLNSLPDWSFRESRLFRVSADRRVAPEQSSNNPAPVPNGDGVTNLIRYFLHNDAQPRDLVEVDLLSDLNHIYRGDCVFSSIACQEAANGNWEIYLREEGGTDVRLSQSGSSLQSVFVILAYFRLVPRLDDIDWKNVIYAFEEPENNLHPALLRRLLDYLAAVREREGFSLIFTSHSPICIDWATRREDAKIVHVVRANGASTCKNVLDYGERKQVLDDLDVRGSDILQSNGIIWVEGPSDRIYIRKWLEIFFENSLVEGVHYSFMYYGGRVLAHFEAKPRDEQSQLISMVSTNRNVAIVMDSDRKRRSGSTRQPSRRLSGTKLRLIDEVEKHQGFFWITEGREIENYVPTAVWNALLEEPVSIADEFEEIPALDQVRLLARTKVDLARAVTAHFELRRFQGYLDLEERISELGQHIRRWNSMF